MDRPFYGVAPEREPFLLKHTGVLTCLTADLQDIKGRFTFHRVLWQVIFLR